MSAPAAAAALSSAQVLAWRCERQGLRERAPAQALLDVVRRIAGVHAQVAASAELTLLARLDGLAPGAVDRVLWEERTLVRTWAQRGTLHLLPADELGLWVAAQGRLKPRHHQPAWLRHYGLTREAAERMLLAIPRVLRGRVLTREELADEVAREAGEPVLAEKLRGGFGDLLKLAAFAGDLLYAPSDGQRVRFTHPETWLGRPLEIPSGEHAEREVARRYLHAYGPASRASLARWFGSPSAPRMERWFRALGEDAVHVEVEGATRWALAQDVEAMQAAEPTGLVRLLPAFDHYVVAAPRDEEAVLPAAHRARVYRPQGWLSPVVVRDGVVLATWRHELARGRLAVGVEPLAGALPGAVVRGVEAEAERLGTYLGASAEVSVSS